MFDVAEGGGRPRKNNRLEMETTIRSFCYRTKASMIGPVNRATQVITIRFERSGIGIAHSSIGRGKFSIRERLKGRRSFLIFSFLF